MSVQPFQPQALEWQRAMRPRPWGWPGGAGEEQKRWSLCQLWGGKGLSPAQS